MYGSYDNPKLTYSGYVNLRAGLNKISLLSVVVGLPVSNDKHLRLSSHKICCIIDVKFPPLKSCLLLRHSGFTMRRGMLEYLVLSL